MPLYNRTGKGTYWRALGFAQELVKNGYEVTILAIAPNQKWHFSEYTIDGVRIVETPDLMPRSGYDLWDVVRRISWLRQRPFDLIHTFETRPVAILPSLFSQRQNNIPLITDWCDWFGRGGSVEERQNKLIKNILRPVETFFEEYFRPGADGITIINTVLQKKATELGIPQNQQLLLPNGANIQAIYPQPKQKIRKHLGLPARAFYLGYTGSMFLADAHLMAAAFNKIQAQFPQARLLLIGYSNIAVEQMVNVPEAVIRTGPVSYQQLADYVAACDIGWLPLADTPANKGRFPLKASDFMAAGRPLLVSDVGDLGSFVKQWELGWSAKAQTAALAQAVLDIISEPDLLTKTGTHARHIAETQFAWPVVTKKLDNFYKQILG